MDDLIRREDALSCFHSWIDTYGDLCSAEDMVEYQAIEALPSIEAITEQEAWKISDVFQDHYCMGLSEIAEEDEVCKSIFRKVGLL